MKRVDEQADGPFRRTGVGRARVVLAVLALGMSAAACGDDDKDPSAVPATTTERRSTASSTTTTSTTATSADQGAEDVVVARYLAFWQARLEANQAPPNPEHPALAEYATGPQLENVTDETRRRRDQGLAIRRPDNSRSRHDVRVISATPDEATLQDCSVNDGVIYRIDSGEVVNDDVVTQSIRATMRVVGGLWKLERASLVQEWPGVAGCAVAG